MIDARAWIVSATQQQLQEKHSGRRVTDAELDEHLRFLATIGNMHGVSDHDLLFDGGAPTDAGDAASDVRIDDALAALARTKTESAMRAIQPPSVSNEADTSLARLVLENYNEDAQQNEKEEEEEEDEAAAQVRNR